MVEEEDFEGVLEQNLRSIVEDDVYNIQKLNLKNLKNITTAVCNAMLHPANFLIFYFILVCFLSPLFFLKCSNFICIFFFLVEIVMHGQFVLYLSRGDKNKLHSNIFEFTTLHWLLSCTLDDTKYIIMEIQNSRVVTVHIPISSISKPIF